MYKVLKGLPSDFPVTEAPYKEIAEKLGIGEAELLTALTELKEQGIIRRIAAILYHRKASYTHNVMVVWRVEDVDVDRVGHIMASFPEVSHCYERDKGGYWDYNIYTMIHGKSLEDCKAIIRRIADASGVEAFRMFFSKREFKKIALRVIHE